MKKLIRKIQWKYKKKQFITEFLEVPIVGVSMAMFVEESRELFIRTGAKIFKQIIYEHARQEFADWEENHMLFEWNILNDDDVINCKQVIGSI